ncbi:MAG: S41 family peptidase [Gemmatimonadota bacterium]
MTRFAGRLLGLSVLAAPLLAPANLPTSPRPGVPASADSLLSCPEVFEAAARTLEADYAGYLLEIKPRPERYRREVGLLRSRAARSQGDACFFVLRDFVAWFHDPHLFIYQHSTIDSAEASRRTSAVRVVSTDESAARAYYDRKRRDLDPLEGIWSDGALRVAVLPDSTGTKRSFIAVVLTADSANWRPGAVRARFTRRSAGNYDADLSARDYSRHHLAATLHKRVLLRLSPGMWGKVYPLRPADRGLVDSIDPHRSTLVTRGGTVIVSIPSHDPAYGPAFDSLIAEHASQLTAADRLIVDLRGNEGGSAQMANALRPWIASAHQPPFPLEYRKTLIESSPDLIHYASRAFGPDSSPHVQRLLARMNAHPGEIVPVFDSLEGPPASETDSVIQGPRRVGVLSDGGTVSASEVMLLDAVRSSRVTSFGQPTEGALYYQSTTVVWFSPRERRWGFGFPTQIAAEWLPGPDTRRHGIEPQVRLDLDRLADPLATVDRALQARQ